MFWLIGKDMRKKNNPPQKKKSWITTFFFFRLILLSRLVRNPNESQGKALWC
jgi:hypothetical protein